MSDLGLGFGFRVGHWSDPEARTGCTVVLPPRPNVASCEIRGSSPGSRELSLLHPDRKIEEIHGLLLTGGSAFGLAAADGVVAWLEEHGIGYETRVARVPLVPAAVVFDLGTGDPNVRPRAEHGYAACENAVEEPVQVGRVGAGSGTTVGKWAGLEFASPGGVGIGHASLDGYTAAALAVVNSVGDVIDADGSVIAGTRAQDPRPRFAPPPSPVPGNTVLAVVAVSASLDKRDVKYLAARGADGITISVRPAHTRYDGDVVFAVASMGGNEKSPRRPETLDALGYLATDAVAAAVRSAARAQA